MTVRPASAVDHEPRPAYAPPDSEEDTLIDFGVVDAIDAEAIGEPGQRTFRLRARAGSNFAALWMEKEQLATLGRAISQVLAERSRQRGQPSEAAGDIGVFIQFPDVDMQVVRLGLDFDVESDHLVLLADDQAGLDRGDTPTFRLEIARADALSLVSIIGQVVAAGRPLCPLCGRAIEAVGQAHFCPGSNGHSKEMPIPDANDSGQP
jgi:uncharacterized repeat protein (TIGR03847 family)